MACYDEARQYAMRRVQFDRPIGGFQLVQAKLARMLTEITKAQLLALRLAQMKDAGTVKHYHISMAKMNNVEIALDAARTARDILGGVGILDEHQCFRHMCNLESVKTYEGTHDVHLLVLGEQITGMSAFAVYGVPKSHCHPEPRQTARDLAVRYASDRFASYPHLAKNACSLVAICRRSDSCPGLNGSLRCCQHWRLLLQHQLREARKGIQSRKTNCRRFSVAFHLVNSTGVSSKVSISTCPPENRIRRWLGRSGFTFGFAPQDVEPGQSTIISRLGRFRAKWHRNVGPRGFNSAGSDYCPGWSS